MSLQPRIQLWSSGGGTQSTAIAILILQGKLSKPDLVCIVDTGRELASTFQYADEWAVPALAQVGVTLNRVHKNDYATVDLFSSNGDVLIPAFTETGKLPTFCSNEWKARVVRRWANEQKPDSLFDIWMGISRDEPRRIKGEIGKWQYRYPLIELRLTRQDCIQIVRDYGWPTPPRSSCWMCPNHTKSEWRRIRDEQPEEFEKAVAFEALLRMKDDGLTLAQGGVLTEAVNMDQGGLFDTERCDSGYCFV